MTIFSDNLNSKVEALIASGKISSTGVGRFTSLIADVSARLSLPVDEIYIVSCQRPNNLNIRLTQGTAQHRHRRLGIGVIPVASDPEKIIESALRAGSNFIGDGKAQYDAVGVVVKRNGRWEIGGIVETSNSGIATALRVDFPQLVESKVNAAAPPVTPSMVPASNVSSVAVPVPVGAGIEGMVRAFYDDLCSSGLIFSDELVIRFCSSLLARPFVVLSGLSGSGKTKLAEAFSRWLTPKAVSGVEPYYKIIPVGADWTSSEQVLGYADALNPGRYETRASLDLLLNASEPARASFAHMLILDEMNLSHVERYFSEFLSAMETGAAIDLYTGAPRGAVPPSTSLSANLFVAGTVNVDETTYLFSPKVLDRANVIEFRADEDQVFSFLESFDGVEISGLDGLGVAYAPAFLAAAASKPQLASADKEAVADAFRRIFRLLSACGREFGFRTLKDVGRYVFFHHLLVGEASWNVNDAIDAQIYQRVLPRLHGSRAQVQLLIWALASLCISDNIGDAAFETTILKPLSEGAGVKNPFEAPEFAGTVTSGFATARYPLSCAKLARMDRKLRDGFVSFMEA